MELYLKKEHTLNSNIQYRQLLSDVNRKYNYISNPRGMKVKEVINGHYTFEMPAFITIPSRSVNKAFMFAEAAWIISGSNRLEDISKYMKVYENFSDDKMFLRGAYGPKVVDQLGYVVDTLFNDNDSRQAVMTIWRERPGISKDIPCTVAAQFLLRDGKLHSIFTMRSNDAVLGVTYDIFTFSMITYSVSLLLRARGLQNELGDLHVNAGSLHIYERHFDDIHTYINDQGSDDELTNHVEGLMKVETYPGLIRKLKYLADKISNK